MTRLMARLMARRAQQMFSAVTVAALFLVLAAPTLAQRGRGQGDGEGGSPQQSLDRRFEEQAPAVGDLVPDLPVYAPDGQELRLRDLLLDHYTVLILGCLT